MPSNLMLPPGSHRRTSRAIQLARTTWRYSCAWLAGMLFGIYIACLRWIALGNVGVPICLLAAVFGPAALVVWQTKDKRPPQWWGEYIAYITAGEP